MTAGPARILLVEDDRADEALTLLALEEADVPNAVDVARDGLEALECLLDRGRPLPGLVLLDLKLPKIGGLEVLRRLREHERTRLLPVVILTNSRERLDLVTGYANGANSYLRKPVNFDQFAAAVGQLCAYWLELNESAIEEQ